MPSDPRLAATTPASETLPAGGPPAGTDDTVAAHPFATRGPASFRLDRGATMGRYVVLDRIGEGGMGVVYKAYDPELDRRLAVKILHEGAGASSGGSEGRARLLREGQALARLSHPNVIAVYDVGTYQGQVFIAMEFVDGGTLRAWTSEGTRAWQEIVSMFVQAGRGLAAAHDAGIVHRDFKGDNVLVGRDGRARVLDFGLARSAGGPVRGGESVAQTQYADRKTTSLETPLTHDGVLLGTPRYMAPEQLAGERSDAAADQFGFCVALYEALYGEPPFDGNDLLTLSSNVLSGRIRAVGAMGRKVPSWLRPIVGRGLSVKADDRYRSMAALLEALERDPAVVRRRKISILGGAAGIAVVIGGLIELRAHRPVLCPSAEPEVESVWGDAQKREVSAAFRATNKPYAEDARGGVQRALDAYARAWVTMRDDACAATRVRGSQSAELMDLRMSCLGNRLAGLRGLVAQFAHADAANVERAVVAASSLEPLAGCADPVALRAPGLPGDPATRKRIDEVRGQIASAQAVAHAIKPADALPPAEAALAAAKAIGYRPLEAEALEALGIVQDLQSDWKHAIPTLEDALLAAEAGRHESLETELWIDLVHANAKDQRNAEAHVAAKQAQALLERDGSAYEARQATLLLDEAIVAYNEGHHAEAIDLGKRALAIRERILPPDHPDIADCLNQLGNVSSDNEDFPTALAFHQRALSIRENALGSSHPLVAISLNNIGNVLSQTGDLDGAIAVYRRALAIKIAAFGEDALTVANTLGVLGLTLTLQHKYEEALEVIERSRLMRVRLLGPDHVDVGKDYTMLAEPQLALHRWDAAIESATRAIAIEEHAMGADAPMLAAPLTDLGHALLGKGDAAHALPVLERALRLALEREGSAGRAAGTKVLLARALIATHSGDAARIHRLIAEARATYQSMGAPTKDELDQLDKDFPPR